MPDNISSLIWKTAEFLFIGLMVVTLPLWFPPLALWVIIDAPHHVKVWLNRRREKEAAKRKIEAQYPAQGQKPAEAGILVLSPQSS